MKTGIYNAYQFSAEAADEGKPITVPYGTWRWSEALNQRLDKGGAVAIEKQLAEVLKDGGLGIPVYQGHPDVPELAAKYPDKGAFGWIDRIEVDDTEMRLFVTWDRYPSKGFGFFSPYWFGKTVTLNGKNTVIVDELRSIGMVNRPRIKNFRLPNEEEEQKTGEKMNSDTMKKVLAALGLAETATEDELLAKVSALVAERDKANADLNEANACANECKKRCANIEEELERAKTALANEKEETEKLRHLKTASVTEGLANEGEETVTRLGLVNEIMAKEQASFEQAWEKAKARKPELFK